jgi:ADP-ribosylglycohydrolase
MCHRLSASATVYFDSVRWCDEQGLVDATTKITHYNDDAVNGAKLQCAAVRLALKRESSHGDFDPHSFLKDLQLFMSKQAKQYA